MPVVRPSSPPNRILAACQAGNAVGDLVFEVSAGVPNPNVDLADPTDRTKMPAIGIIVSKPTATLAVVHVLGDLDGLTGLTDGEIHYVSATGKLTPTPPVPPPAGVAVQQSMGQSLGTTRILLSPSNDLRVRIA